MKDLTALSDKELKQHILELEGTYSRCRDWWESHIIEESWNKAIAEQTRRIVKEAQ